jgi:hypothetical protein
VLFSRICTSVDLCALLLITSRCVMQSHTCAVLVGGAVQCWGYNYYGQVMLFALCFDSMMHLHNVELCFTHFGLSQLGDGKEVVQRLTPVGVSGLSSGVSSISLGGVRYMFGLLLIETV